MPYAIQPEDESVPAALRRIAREQAENALAATQGEGDLAPRVHTMRKSVKKLRGLLRLVRPVLPAAKKENATLRDAGRGLSALRDAAVQLETIESLTEEMEPSRRARLLAPFQDAASRHDAEAEEATLPAFASVMSDFRDRSQSWSPRRDGWDALEPGLAATWDAVRAALRQARKAPAPDNLHEWRKRTKDHWYQARLLQPIWPPLMTPHIEAADELGELLGQIHDLDVLKDRLASTGLEAGLLSEARDLADLRRARLLEQALPLGRRLFAGPGEALVARWRGWWALRDAA